MRLGASTYKETEIRRAELPEMWLRNETIRPNGTETRATERERGRHRQGGAEDSDFTQNESGLS